VNNFFNSRLDILGILPQMGTGIWGQKEFGLGTIENLLGHPEDYHKATQKSMDVEIEAGPGQEPGEQKNTEQKQNSEEAPISEGREEGGRTEPPPQVEGGSRETPEIPAQERNFKEVPSLKSLAENFICENTAREDFPAILEVAEIFQFSRLTAYFLSLLFREEVQEEDIQKTEDLTVASRLGVIRDVQKKIFMLGVLKKLRKTGKPESKSDDYDWEDSSEEDSDDGREDSTLLPPAPSPSPSPSRAPVLSHSECVAVVVHCLRSLDQVRLSRFVNLFSAALPYLSMTEEERLSFHNLLTDAQGSLWSTENSRSSENKLNI
jgi:hypothetical protein